MSSGGIIIELPFPPASLSGHNTGHWKGKAGPVAYYREAARWETCNRIYLLPGVIPEDGDVPISITFHPPNKRGDRVNFPNRAKPLIDGIADALGINDRRFLPSYHFAEPIKGGKIIVRLEPWE